MAKYSKGAQKKVEKEMHESKLKNGGSGKKGTNPRQAKAIGLSETREEGKKGPKNRSSLPKSAFLKTGNKKSPSRSAAEKKPVPKKSKIWGASTSRSSARSSAPKKTVPKKETPKKLVYKRSVPKKIAAMNESPEKSEPKKAAPKRSSLTSLTPKSSTPKKSVFRKPISKKS